MTEAATPLPSPLLDRHEALGAKLVEFAGWLMPIQYAGIIEEHRAVRSAAGLFDLSHMGELVVEGEDAGPRWPARSSSDPPALAVGRAHYSMICAPDGGILDDLIVYRLADDRFMVVANASNARVVSDALAERLDGFRRRARRPLARDRPRRRAGPALAGHPRAVDGPRPVGDQVLRDRGRRPSPGSRPRSRGPATRARTASSCSSTSIAPASCGTRCWRPGGPHGQVPVGLGARDTLRLEAGMPLYGNELDRSTNPFEAGLGRVVKLSKPGDFVGRAALERVVRDGVQRHLVGLEMRDRGIARHGYPVLAGDAAATPAAPIGTVTSGTMSPTLNKAIAMAYVPPDDAAPATMLAVEIRGAPVAAEVVPLPFYKRPA